MKAQIVLLSMLMLVGLTFSVSTAEEEIIVLKEISAPSNIGYSYKLNLIYRNSSEGEGLIVHAKTCLTKYIKFDNNYIPRVRSFSLNKKKKTVTINLDELYLFDLDAFNELGKATTKNEPTFELVYAVKDIFLIVTAPEKL
jgi:hypothetical protein